ncbi:low molecular weight protein-tyrosine-phosphatase [soil metagenome]
MFTATSILFVCLGNICRSPLAEAVFRHHARERGVEDRFQIDSAATSHWEVGNSRDPRTVRTARARGIEVTGRSRQLTAEDLQRFDFVIAMDAENLADIRALQKAAGGSARVHRLREWDPGQSGRDVPDPYVTGHLRGFEEVHQMVERSCAGLLDHLLAEQGSG